MPKIYIDLRGSFCTSFSASLNSFLHFQLRLGVCIITENQRTDRNHSGTNRFFMVRFSWEFMTRRSEVILFGRWFISEWTGRKPNQEILYLYTLLSLSQLIVIYFSFSLLLFTHTFNSHLFFSLAKAHPPLVRGGTLSNLSHLSTSSLPLYPRATVSAAPPPPNATTGPIMHKRVPLCLVSTM